MFHVEKSVELSNAIQHKDRKLTRKLLLEEGVGLTNVCKQSLDIFLKEAVEARDALLVRKLLQMMPDVSALFAARILRIVVEDGDTEIASMLVRAGADVNMNSPYAPHILHVLAASKNPKKLELAVLMMEHGADVMAADEDGATALTYAICNDNFDFAKQLLKRNSPVDKLDVEEAVYSSKILEWINVFIDDYPDNKVTRTKRISHMFYWLSDIDADGQLISQCLIVLLEVQVPDVDVIYEAVLSGKISLAKTILDSCLIDDSTKMMLLHPAVSLRDTAITKLLINWGALVDYQLEVDVGVFPAHTQPIHAACAGRSKDNIEFLLRLGADINIIDDFGMTPLSAIFGADENEPKLSVISQLVIEHLALSVVGGTELKGIDHLIIHNDLDLLEFYEKCLEEVQFMKRFKVLNNFSFYSIFKTNTKKLSMLTKRHELVKHSNRDLLNFLFPIYFEELNWRLAKAETRRDLLSHTENALYDTVGNILPDLVIDKIMFHLYDSDINLEVS